MLNFFLWAILERPIRQSGSSDEKGARIQGEPNSLGKKIANFWIYLLLNHRIRISLNYFDRSNGVWCYSQRYSPLLKKPGLGRDSVKKLFLPFFGKKSKRFLKNVQKRHKTCFEHLREHLVPPVGWRKRGGRIDCWSCLQRKDRDTAAAAAEEEEEDPGRVSGLDKTASAFTGGGGTLPCVCDVARP